MPLYAHLLFGGAVLVFITFADVRYSFKPHLFSAATLLIGVALLLAGLLILGHTPNEPEEWKIDQVQYIPPEGWRSSVLIVNARDSEGNMRPQFRQLAATPALANLMKELADNPDKRSFVTVIWGDKHHISEVEVWHDRYGPPEIHKFERQH